MNCRTSKSIEMSEAAYKKTSTELASNIILTLPLIEEITKQGVTPICLIGLKPNLDANSPSTVWFATLNDSPDLEKMLLEIMRQAVEQKSK